MSFLAKNSVPVHLARREALPVAVNEALRAVGTSVPGSSLVRKPSASLTHTVVPASALSLEAKVSAPKVPTLTPSPAAPPSPSIMRLDVQRAALEAQSQANLAQREQVLSTRLRPSNPLDEAFTRLKTPTSATSSTSGTGPSKIPSPNLKPVRLEVELTSRMGRAEERAATAVEQRLLDDRRIESGLSPEQIQTRRHEQSRIEQEQRFGPASSGRGHLLKSAGHDWAANVLSLGQELAQVSGAEGFAQYQKTQREEHQAAAEYHRSQAIKSGRIVEWEQVTQEGQYAVKGIGQASFSTSEGANGSFQTSLNSALAFSGRLGEYIETLYLQSSPYLLESVAGGFAGRAVAGSLQLGAQALRRAGMIGAAAVSLPSSSGRVLNAQRENSQALHGVEETHLPSAIALGGVGAAVNAVLGVDRMLANLSTQVLNPARLAAVPALARPVVGSAVQVGAVTGGEAITEVVQGFTERTGAKVSTDKMQFFTLDYGRQVISELRDGGLMGWAGGSVGQGLRATRAATDEARAWLHTQEAAAPRIVDSNGKVLYVEKKPTSTSELLPEWLQGLEPRHYAEPSGVGIHPSQLLGWLVPPRQQFIVPPKPERGSEGYGFRSDAENSRSSVVDVPSQKTVPRVVKDLEMNPAHAQQEQVLVPETAEDLALKKSAVRVAKTLLEAEPGVLEEIMLKLKQHEAGAEETQSPLKKKTRNSEYHEKLRNLTRVNGVRTDVLSWLQPVLRPGESATQSIQLLINQPEVWGQGRAHLPQVDSSVQAIEQLEGRSFEVLERLIQGFSVEDIAQQLKIKKVNVEQYHLQNIFQALGVLSWPDALKRYPEGLEALALKVKQVKLNRSSEGRDIGSAALRDLHPTSLLVLGDLVAGLDRTAISVNRKLGGATLRTNLSRSFTLLGIKNIEQLIDHYVGKDLYGDLQAEYARRVVSNKLEEPEVGKRRKILDVERVPPSVLQELVKGIWAKTSNEKKLPYLISFLRNETPLLKDSVYELPRARAINDLAAQLNIESKQFPGFLARAFGTRKKPNGLNEAIKYLQERVPARAELGLPVNKLQAQSRIVSILLNGGHDYFSQLLFLIRGGGLTEEIARANAIPITTLRKNMKEFSSLLGVKQMPKNIPAAIDLIAEALRPAVLSTGTLEGLLERIVKQPKEWVRSTGLIRPTDAWTIYKKLTLEEQALLHQYALHEYDLPALAAALNKSKETVGSEIQKILNNLGQSSIEVLKFSYTDDLNTLDQRMAEYANRSFESPSKDLEPRANKKKKPQRRAQDFLSSFGDWWAPKAPSVDKGPLNAAPSLDQQEIRKEVIAPSTPTETASVGFSSSEVQWLLGLKNGLKQSSGVGRGGTELIARKLLLTDGKVLREALLYLKYLENPSAERYYGSSNFETRVGLLNMTHGAYGSMSDLDALLKKIAVGSETPEQVIVSLLENRHEWRKARGYLRQIDTSALKNLKDREVEVAGWAARGLKDEQIAQELSLNWQTVREYRQSAFNKLGFYNYKDIKDNYGLNKFATEVEIERLRRTSRSKK